MKVVICALAKNEHEYINDWVKHHIDIGFDKIYLYDNDDKGSAYIVDFIDTPYKKYVEIIDIRGTHINRLQQKIYTNFYGKYGTSFDWCLFCDIDEFLFGVDDVKKWLSNPMYNNKAQIRVKWKLFGDDDLITRDLSVPVYNAFKNEVKSSLHRNLIYKGNLEQQGKMLVHGGMSNIVISSPHFASKGNRDNVLPSILPSGISCNSKVVIYEDYSNEHIYLHHYMTKSLSEFIRQKLNRTDAVFEEISIKLDYFWRINKQTKEKIEYLSKLGLL